MCELLVGLPDVEVLGVQRDAIMVTIEIQLRQDRPACLGCERPASIKDTDVVELVDLPCFDRRSRLRWRKRRWQCRHSDCDLRSWTKCSPRIAASRLVLTDRAGRWACEQVGRHGRTVNKIVFELGCDWHTVNSAVAAYGTPLIEHPDRVGTVKAIGLDEILAVRAGPYRHQRWATVVVDVAGRQLQDMVEGRDATPAVRWLESQPRAGLDAIAWACRRRVQNDTLGHRGRRDDPLYRTRRRLTIGAERLTDTQRSRVLGLLAAGDPHGEVRMAWHVKETLRGFYIQPDEAAANVWIDEFIDDTTHISMPLEVRRLGRTIRRWRAQLLAWHRCWHTNGPTESMNNLIKRVAFGFRNLTNFRIRALLYAGKPNWDLLATVAPR